MKLKNILKKNSVLILLVTYILFTGCSSMNIDELESMTNKINILEDKLEEKESIISTLESEITIKSDELDLVKEKLIDALDALQPTYKRYSADDKDLFTGYISDNPIDKKYEIDYELTLKESEIGYQDSYYLEHSYERLWEIEMLYAYQRLSVQLDEEVRAYLTESQLNFQSEIDSIDEFLYYAFDKNDISINDNNTRAIHRKNLYRNRTIELLEYLYILEGGKKPTFLFEDYIEEHELIQLAGKKIQDTYWDDLEVVMAIEQRLSALNMNSIHIYKLHGYKVIPESHNYMRKFSVDAIEIYGADFELIQSIEVPITLVPSGRLFDYGFKVVDWNFDGYPDISLFAMEGGTMLNAPSYYWLWDNEKSKYILNDILTDFSQLSWLSVDNEKKEVVSSYRAQGHHSTNLVWVDDDLVPVSYEGVDWVQSSDNTYQGYLVKKIYENGEWLEIERIPFEDN